ncbi:MAG: carboxymuconolactone decarboxylase family protein [Bacteroidia bacterium]|nr:carboxymuconolactone decarboxylase family protein [Bacteroidia bacterium]
MSFIQPISKKEESRFQFLFDVVKKSMGFVPNSMKTMAREPAILANFSLMTGTVMADPKKTSPLAMLKLILKNMGWSAKYLKRRDRVPLYLRQLVAHVSSNASGCRYCQAHTIEGALHQGATQEQLNTVWDFENSDAFDDKEKAALRFGYAAGSIPNAVTEQHFTDLKKYFTEAQILELGTTVSVFGFLNRWNDTFGTTLEEQPKALAEKYLAQSGWEIGKHQ